MIHNRIITLIIVIILVNYPNIYSNFQLEARVFSMKPSLSTLPDIYVINWKIILLRMLSSVHFFDYFINEGLVVVNIIKNNTNGIFQSVKITNILIELIMQNTKRYDVVDMDTLYHAYRKLEVSPNNILNSYSFSVEIANYLKANYVIYGIAYGNSDNPNLELQLISIKTGEIICTVCS